jgi:hypothetical protein
MFEMQGSGNHSVGEDDAHHQKTEGRRTQYHMTELWSVSPKFVFIPGNQFPTRVIPCQYLENELQRKITSQLFYVLKYEHRDIVIQSQSDTTLCSVTDTQMQHFHQHDDDVYYHKFRLNMSFFKLDNKPILSQ